MYLAENIERIQTAALGTTAKLLGSEWIKNTHGGTKSEYASIIPPWAENEPRRPGCDWQARSAAIAKSPFPHRTCPANIFAPDVPRPVLRAGASI